MTTTDPTPADTAELPCRCGHPRNRHTPRPGDTWTGAQCDDCPGDEERSWRHPYTPADTTRSAREILPVPLDADPYIPEAHDDEDEPYRDDVRDALTAHGWAEDAEGFLRKDDALWTETNESLDSGLDGPGKGYAVEFTRDVPAPVVVAACLAAVGVDVPALLAERERVRAGRDRYRTAWQSARRRAARRQPHEREGLIFHLERENARLHAFVRLAHEAAEVSAKAWEQGSAEVARFREDNARLRARVAELEAAMAAESLATEGAVTQTAHAIRDAASETIPDDELPYSGPNNWPGPTARCTSMKHRAPLSSDGTLGRHRISDGFLGTCPGSYKAPRENPWPRITEAEAARAGDDTPGGAA
jgi:hypothetical protein